MADPAPFHKLAKEAGTRLGAYVLSYASGASAAVFLGARLT